MSKRKQQRTTKAIRQPGRPVPPAVPPGFHERLQETHARGNIDHLVGELGHSWKDVWKDVKVGGAARERARKRRSKSAGNTGKRRIPIDQVMKDMVAQVRRETRWSLTACRLEAAVRLTKRGDECSESSVAKVTPKDWFDRL